MLKSHRIKHPLKNHFFNIMILAWISSRYECWDQSSFSLIHIETYMNQHQYGQANSWFLVSFSFWLDTSNTHFNIYLHTSSLIKLMHSDFPNLYPYKQTNVETDLYLIWIVSFVIWPLLDISSLMHPWFILQSLIKASPLSNSSCSCKEAITETNPKSSTHVSFAIC